MGVKAAASQALARRGRDAAHRAPRLSAELGARSVLKIEGANPTGSFKDRGMVVAVACAVEAGAHAVVCASTGNTAASAAAYAARAGLRAVVLTPAGGTASAKRAQARAAGAHVIEIRGTFDDALRLAQELCEQDGFVLVNSASPDRNRIAGQKLVAATRSSSSSAPLPTRSRFPTAAAGTQRRLGRASRARTCRRRSSPARRPSGRPPSRRRSGSASRRTPRRSDASPPRGG